MLKISQVKLAHESCKFIKETKYTLSIQIQLYWLLLTNRAIQISYDAIWQCYALKLEGVNPLMAIVKNSLVLSGAWNQGRSYLYANTQLRTWK